MGAIGDAIHEAGWPAYPIIALGMTAIALSLRHAAAPSRSALSLIVGLAVACFLMGVFGTTVGLMHAIEGTSELPPEQRWLVVKGLKEALNCLAVALLLLLPTVLATMVGSFRLRARLDEIAAK